MMENNIDQLKQELVQEIKDLAAEIAKSHSYVGLLSNEIKFRALHEKFINLKFLERKHIGLNIFDQPIPVKDEKNEVFSDDQERFADEQIQEYNFEPQFINKPEIPEIVPEVEAEKPEIEEVATAIEQEIIEDITPDNPKETHSEKEILGNPYTDAEYDFTGLVSGKSFPKIQIDFNDRIAFLNQLFDQDAQKMDKTVERLNKLNSANESNHYINELKEEMHWKGKEEYVERLKTLIAKRFE